MCPVPDPRLGSIHSQLLCIRPEEIPWLLLSTGEDSPVRLSMPYWWVDVTCLFATSLANSVCHATIKVYLSGVCSLHIDQGFPDPLLHCLHLQCVLRGIKRSQGDLSRTRLPVTGSLVLTIFHSLDLLSQDHCNVMGGLYLSIFWLSSFIRVYCPFVGPVLRRESSRCGWHCSWLPGFTI